MTRTRGGCSCSELCCHRADTAWDAQLLLSSGREERQAPLLLGSRRIYRVRLLKRLLIVHIEKSYISVVLMEALLNIWLWGTSCW